MGRPWKVAVEVRRHRRKFPRRKPRIGRKETRRKKSRSPNSRPQQLLLQAPTFQSARQLGQCPGRGAVSFAADASFLSISARGQTS